MIVSGEEDGITHQKQKRASPVSEIVYVCVCICVCVYLYVCVCSKQGKMLNFVTPSRKLHACSLDYLHNFLYI